MAFTNVQALPEGYDTSNFSQFGGSPPDNLTEFRNQLAAVNDQFLNPAFSNINGGDISQFKTGIDSELSNLNNIGNTFNKGIGGLIAEQQGRAQGIDPRFEAFKQSQLAQLKSNQLGQQTQESEFFNRRGLGGSTAALNAQNRTSDSFNQQRLGLDSQIGLQQLGRQDNALSQLQSLYGQQAQFGTSLSGQRAGLQSNRLSGIQSALGFNNQVESNRLNSIASGLENLTIGEQLAIARLAAENAGKGGGGGGNGSPSGIESAGQGFLNGLGNLGNIGAEYLSGAGTYGGGVAGAVKNVFGGGGGLF